MTPAAATRPRIEDLDIREVALSLGLPVRGDRFQVAWRKGDSWSGSLKPRYGSWMDHKNGDKGGIIGLVEIAMGCDRSEARAWLEERFGIEPLQAYSPEERRKYAHRMEAARRLAATLAERRDFELNRVREMKRALLEEYHRLDRLAVEEQDLDTLMSAIRKYSKLEELDRLHDLLKSTDGPELVRIFLVIDKEGL